MKGLPETAVIGLMLLLVPVSAYACSYGMCLDRGIETNRDFVVVVKHAGKPLRGVSVKVTSSAENSAGEIFSAVTAPDGKVHVTHLAPGDYWLDTDLLGISAGSHCFHVAERPSRKAKHSLAYEWGDLAPATRRIAGSLIDSVPGADKSPLGLLIHRVNVPIQGARFRLQNPLTGEKFDTSSKADGGFAFDLTPDGEYVLHVEIEENGRVDSSDFLISLAGTARKSSLILTRKDAGGGGCGGTGMELR